jgi:hypothetical protein
MDFEIISGISDIHPIAIGFAIREIERLKKIYGKGRWRKLKGMAIIRLSDGYICKAELHWYECHSIGKKEIKIKQLHQEKS